LSVVEFQIREQLRLVNVEDLFNHFQFNNDAVLNDQINSVGPLDHRAIVDNGQPHLLLNRQAAFSELLTQALLIHAL